MVDIIKVQTGVDPLQAYLDSDALDVVYDLGLSVAEALAQGLIQPAEAFRLSVIADARAAYVEEEEL